jgi:hypothetical protein
MSLQSLVRLSQIKKKSLPDYARQQSAKKMRKKMTTNVNVMMIGYDIYDRFTMEHFSLCQSMILTTSFFFLATVRSSKNLQKDKLSRYVILSVIATTGRSKI